MALFRMGALEVETLKIHAAMLFVFHVKILIVFVLSVFVYEFHGKVFVDLTKKLDLIVVVSKVLCKSHNKVFYVYFENETSLGYSGEILREITNCGKSYVSLRNKFKTSPLEVIKDDGIVMYLVMIMSNVSQRLETSIMKKKSSAKHLSHVLLLVTNSDTVTESWMRATFRKFWKIWLLNIVIIYWRESQLHIYRYNPFTNNYLIKVTYNDAFPTLTELFPKSIPDMQRKPLRMCIYPEKIRAIYFGSGSIFGTDGFMSGYIAQRLNATRIVDRAYPYGNYNLSADICFMEVVNEYDDIAMNIRFLAPDSFEKQVEPTIAHGRDDLCVITPKAEPASTFWNLFRSFGIYVWFSIALSIVLANIFLALVYRDHCFSECSTLQLFACIISVPLTRPPNLNSLRLFLIFFLFFGMLICTAFRGNLTSILVSHKNLPDINTVEELAFSPYQIMVRTRHVKHIERFLDINNPHEAIIKHKMKIVTEETLLDHFNHNNLSFAYLEKFHVGSFEINARPHMHLGRPLFHLMNTCLVPFHAVYIVPFGSPYLGFINNLIRSSHEFGFETYWDRIMNTAFIKSGATIVRRRQNNDDDPVVLKLEHFQAVFGIWFIGMFTCILLFCWELFRKSFELKLIELRDRIRTQLSCLKRES